jgi:Domain of unknown function (DUF4136)
MTYRLSWLSGKTKMVLLRRRAIPALLLLLAAGCLGGCGPTLHQVSVNGYTDLAAPAAIAPGGSFFIIEDRQAKNPLLEKEIKDKIAKLLEQRGYQMAAYEKADYYLFFSYGTGPGRTGPVVMPDYGWGLGGGYGWPSSYFFVAPFTYYPPETLYDRWLLINVVDGKYYREKGEFRALWVGEARSTGTSGDLRLAINYLLLADFKQFGINTGKAVPVEINEQAPQVQGLVK